MATAVTPTNILKMEFDVTTPEARHRGCCTAQRALMRTSIARSMTLMGFYLIRGAPDAACRASHA